MSDPVVLLSTGDVVGPAGGVTDNSMVLFSGTSGKLIKGNNAVVTSAGLALLDDANAAAQRVTLGLGDVDNTSDASKPVSTATQTALNLKAPLASPALTGTPSAPTASAGTDTTQLANTAFVKAAVAAAPMLGVGQTWQNVTGSRTTGTTYTNSTGKPIQICITTGAGVNQGVKITVAGLLVVTQSSSAAAATFAASVSAIVPPGATYSSAITGGLSNWTELR